MIFVLGIDAATWSIIRQNRDRLTSFRKLCDIGQCKELILKEKPISASIWCGKTVQEHTHKSYVVNGNIVKREDIKVDFIWDVLHRQGKVARALNVPFVVPPYCFNVNFKPVGFGLPTDEKEWQEELDRVTEKTKELLAQKPDLLVSVFTLLDRIQHFHWGEDCVINWYQKLDKKLGEIIFNTGYLDSGDNGLIVVSDHGFCSFGDAKIQTLPRETEQGTLKGDHHENALLITVNVAYDIKTPQDVFYAIRKRLS
jgi:predicted AlkP superfamily phosphohydrolase/phosphomutase